MLSSPLQQPPAFDALEHDPELPSYSQSQSTRRRATVTVPQQPATHIYRLLDKSGTAWFIVKCKSRAHRPEQVPRILEGDKVEGSVELNLSNWKSIKSVRIEILGEVVSSASDRLPFVRLSHELWSSSSTSTQSLAINPSQFDKGKLRGRWSWPYTVVLPQTVEMKLQDGKSSSCRLPATSLSRQIHCVVLYRLVATITSGTFLPDYTLETGITYIPLIKPGPPSPVRQLAYQQNCPLVGPDGDPEGWHTLPPLTMTGTMFGDRTVEVESTLSLAKPLSYTRGSSIPLFLTIKCEDLQALAILSSSNAPVVRLRRTLMLDYEGTFSGVYGSKGAFRSPSSKGLFGTGDDPVSYLQLATWWRSPYGSSEGTTRVLQGEIHLSPGLNPTTCLGKYAISYDVALYSPNAVAFVTSSTSSPLQTVDVEIATVYADGPRPVKYAPPQYDN
ncbi:hypothetical protein BC835DRAFT_1411493 [Cytidiella melzeri]|nr:hypothetical protein BC835DRAFT_1411493 [Cytidiella melzeri]